MPIRPESVKRRTIWINDEDWAAMNAQARAADRNISVYIRETLARPIEVRVSQTVRPLASPRPAPKGK